MDATPPPPESPAPETATPAAWIIGITIVIAGTCLGFGFGVQSMFKH